MRRREKTVKYALMSVFIVYIYFLLRIVMFKSGIGIGDFRQLQLVPFAFLKDFADPTTTTDVLMKNILGNIGIFVPLGILLPCFFKRFNLLKTILAGLCLSIAFEVIQFVTGLGMTDIDDVILNTFGGFLGAIIYFKILNKSVTEFSQNLACLIFLVVFGIFGLVSLVKYSPSMLPSNIVYENQEILGGLHEESYKVSGKCHGLKDNIISLEDPKFNENEGKSDTEAKTSYQFAPDCKFIVKTKEFEYSSNGNIQKQIVSYSQIPAEKVDEIVKSENHKFRDKLWLDKEDNCRMIVFTIINN